MFVVCQGEPFLPAQAYSENFLFVMGLNLPHWYVHVMSDALGLAASGVIYNGIVFIQSDFSELVLPGAMKFA